MANAVAELREVETRLELEAFAGAGQFRLDLGDDLCALRRCRLALVLGRHGTDFQLLQHLHPEGDGFIVPKVSADLVQRDFSLLLRLAMTVGAVRLEKGRDLACEQGVFRSRRLVASHAKKHAHENRRTLENAGVE